MPKVAGLHLPETNAQYCGFRQLLLFFDTITQLLPTEDSNQPEDSLVVAGFLQQCAPLPFGEGLDQFNRLIADIQRHGPDFYGTSFSRLSSATGPQVDEASVLELIKLMKPGGIESEKSTQSDSLFQARLLLKLNDIHEIEEKGLQEQMKGINMKNANLLSALKGDEEESANLAGELTGKNESESPLRLKQRLIAWASLYLAGMKEPSWLITTGSEDAVDLLQEGTCSQNKVQHLFSLHLTGQDPNNTIDDQAYISFLNEFHNKTRAYRETLHSFLENAARTGEVKVEMKESEAISAWQNTLQGLPGLDCQKIEFFLLPMPFAELLREGLKIKGSKPTTTPYSNTVVGVLK